MSLTTYPDIDQGTDEWMDLRRGVVTASAVGRLVTPTLKTAANDTSRALLTTLVAERITGWTEETGVTPDMWRGVEAEPVARDLYSSHYEAATELGFMRYDGDGWSLGYSPDGLVGDDGLIEIKAPRAKTHLSTILADTVPPQYMGQCQGGLLVSGRKWIDYVSYVGGMPLFVKRVYPDPEWHDAIRAAVIAFEERAALMVADYQQRTASMPMTKRLDFDLKVA